MTESFNSPEPLLGRVVSRRETRPKRPIVNDATGRKLLFELANVNGRELVFLTNGKICTFDKYDGCDFFASSDIDTVYEWELGYKR